MWSVLLQVNYEIGITIPNLGPQATRENVIHLATQAEKSKLKKNYGFSEKSGNSTLCYHNCLAAFSTASSKLDMQFSSEE